MSLPRFSVRNPVAVNLLMVGILVGGAIASLGLVREFFPKIETEQIVITVFYPGATPDEIERTVTRLVEREIEGIDGIKEIRSRVFEGVTLISAELETGVDRERVLSEMRGEIDKVKPDLPDDAEEPEIVEARPFIPAIAVVAYGDVDELLLHDVAQEIEDDLLRFSVITEVLVTGSRDREFVIEVRPDLLEEHRITLEDVGRALGALNRDVPGGQLKGSLSNIRVRTVGERRIPRELESQVVLTGATGRAITLGELARVRPAFEDKVERGRFRGKRGVSINVFKAPEQDAIKIAQTVRDYVAENPSRLGGAVQLETTTDLSNIIEQRLNLMQRNATAGLILVLLTLAVFLELRVALWVAVGLAVSFMGTFILMAAFDQSINLISLFGLIVVLGLIVDDAIVIGENIFRRQREGMEPHLAAIKGAGEVALPVIGAVLTTIFAFLPLMFIEGRIGSFLGVLPVVVIFALGVSLLEGFVILPGHLAHKGSRLGTWLGGPLGPLVRGLGRWGEARHWLFERALPNLLERQLRFLLRWRYVSIAFAVVLLLGAIGLVRGGQVPFVLLQDVDAETVTVKLEMAAGTPEAETERTLAVVEALFLDQPEVRSVFSVIGTSFSERGQETPSDPAVVGQSTIELYPAGEREGKGQRTSTTMIADLRRQTRSLPGVRRLSYTSQGGGPQGADLELRLSGDDLATLAKATRHARKVMDDYDGVDEIYDDLELGKLEARIGLREDARMLGLTTVGVANQLRHALFGYEVQDLQIGNEEVTVRVMLPEAERRALVDLGTMRLASPAGKRVPLEEAATIGTERGYASIVRVDGRRSATIRASVDEGEGRTVNVAQITRALQDDLADIGERFPGVELAFEGRKKETNESLGSLRILFPIALGAIFCIIAMLFRSYVQPIVVMSIIPFSMVGAILGHLIMGFPVTILSMIGLVALAGIVVNDGLILVDLANRFRRRGMEATEAVVQASRGRMRPILLTSITTCVGLAPLMLETSFQAQFLIPMAISIVFGLAFATGLILALLPMFYLVLEDIRAGLRWIATGRWTHALPHDPAMEMDKAIPSRAET